MAANHSSVISPWNSPTPASTAYIGKQIKYSLWHQRLGHPTNEVAKIVLHSQLSFSTDSVASICSACLHGEMHKLAFSSSHNRSSIPFQRIHSDVWGPSSVRSVDGYRYYVNFVDECTGFYPMYNKSDVCYLFVKFFVMITTHFPAQVQYF